MVHRRTTTATARHDEAAAGGREEATTGRKRKGIRRRRDAITAIKAQMLRCNRAYDEFKRSYLGGGGDQARGDDAAVFYLACLVCSPRLSTSVSNCKSSR